MRNTKEIELGDMIEDTITGLGGIAMAVSDYAFAGPQLTIQPPAKKDGTVPDSFMADAGRFKIIRKHVAKAGEPVTGEVFVCNGDKVRHKITGLEGIVTSTTRHLHGCSVAGVAPMVEKDGKPAERFGCNFNELEVVKKQHLPLTPMQYQNPSKSTGGPATMPEMSRL